MICKIFIIYLSQIITCLLPASLFSLLLWWVNCADKVHTSSECLFFWCSLHSVPQPPWWHGMLLLTCFLVKGFLSTQFERIVLLMHLSPFGALFFSRLLLSAFKILFWLYCLFLSNYILHYEMVPLVWLLLLFTFIYPSPHSLPGI